MNSNEGAKSTEGIFKTLLIAVRYREEGNINRDCAIWVLISSQTTGSLQPKIPSFSFSHSSVRSSVFLISNTCKNIQKEQRQKVDSLMMQFSVILEPVDDALDVTS